jgi:hypothetical protein
MMKMIMNQWNKMKMKGENEWNEEELKMKY